MASTSTRYEPPVPPHDPTDKTGFSYETVVKRWPIILTQLIDHIYQTNHHSQDKEKIEEGKQIIQLASKLKYDMGRDKRLEPIPDDGGPDVELYNNELERLGERQTWFTAPWLYAECYLYRLMRSWFVMTKLWSDHDPFASQKLETFRSSRTAVIQLAVTMQEVLSRKDELSRNSDALEVLFGEMLHMCLWGNATDLSLLTSMTHADIQALQTVSKEAQAERAQFILRDDGKKVWQHLKSHTGDTKRVDIILDNAGFELFTDLVMVDFLLGYMGVSTIVLHPKMIPWFVSDVTPPELIQTIDWLLDPDFFQEPATSQELSEVKGPAESITAVIELGKRLKGFVESGQLQLSVPVDSPIGRDTQGRADFWTSPLPYWYMEEAAPDLLKTLEDSTLVIFKGDLNYRKLTGDVKWPPTTPFETALGPLNGRFSILSLRTNKADVIVGLEEHMAQVAQEKDPKWRVNGRFAVISYNPASDRK